MEYLETLLARIKELEATVKQQQSQIVDLEIDVEEKTNKYPNWKVHALSRCLGRYARGNVAQHPGLYSFGS
jgi:multidrug resistance efflux pump